MTTEPVTDSASPAPGTETSPATSAAQSAETTTAAKPAQTASAAKPAKPPAPEDKPFTDFVPNLLIPAVAAEIKAYGGPDVSMSFEQGPMPVVGSPCWMVKGELPGGRRFWLCFTSDSISSAKTMAVAESGAEPSLLESFLIDEKKMSQALLVSRLVQRLNGQKWLGAN